MPEAPATAGRGQVWSEFTTTHWSLVVAAAHASGAEAQQALESLCRAYWFPIYAYLRQRGCCVEDAQDLTQAFFARLLEKDYLRAADPHKGKFRSFLLACLKHFVQDEAKRTSAAKRGGGQPVLSLDDEGIEHRCALEPAKEISPDQGFDQRWILTLLERALAGLQQEQAAAGHALLFAQLRGFLAEEARDGAYEVLAAQFGMTSRAVAVQVHRLRRRYRQLVREEVAHTLIDPADLDGELHYLYSLLSG